MRPALLWNDVRSAPQATRLVADRGADWWARQTGVVPLAAITVSKLAWVAEHEPDNLARTVEVALPHDWLTGRLPGPQPGPGHRPLRRLGHRLLRPLAGTPTCTDLVGEVAGRDLALPSVLKPSEPAGGRRTARWSAPAPATTRPGAMGLELEPGEVVVSLGTSGTAFTIATAQTADVRGEVAGFADCTGRFLPLVCTLNAARVLSSTAELLGVDLARFSDLALEAPPTPTGCCWSPTSTASARPTCPTPPARWWG